MLKFSIILPGVSGVWILFYKFLCFSDSAEISLEETSEKSAEEFIDETDVTGDIMVKPKCDICCNKENSQL